MGGCATGRHGSVGGEDLDGGPALRDPSAPSWHRQSISPVLLGLLLRLSLVAPASRRLRCCCFFAFIAMVLELSVAGYGTRLASILYYAVVRLDNLGRCVERAADSGDEAVCSSGCFETGRLPL